jgi:hypothetical protein
MNRPEVIALVSCVKSKQTKRAQAKDLYTSPLFRRARRYAEQAADRWFILSAKHGLLDPLKVIAPYEQTLAPMADRKQWAWALRLAERSRTRCLKDCVYGLRDWPTGETLSLSSEIPTGSRSW